ncbi:CDP-diacylglycerol--glycerol-3-phosphate 3-phosphatidyltransferase [Sedimentibacter sp. zth1]|uniref:CDP-diacylglycerol--glycerol-3-phosphate 3-phosphatidyltransferase n=1 Tax=Sedimentibacter sp. zth1 TaxID=2816908 RepID=UPI001A925A13|nr:CDP-diacylglycerol--glycerol-3-phosphate 3-phosphatidyltransferase [Sedimentibacter sp. zth1]QSX07299.1 CDP-diacylglycerol--glycerol-3-phosphate 3-phosphatidyltransferase [Sedimentibacter sp. zth1]
MNLPNKLTILRMCLVPFFVLILLLSNNTNITFFRLLPLIIFVGASITDRLDGQIARKNNLITDFGKFMDPLADKLLVCSALICFIEIDYIASWIVILIVAREFIISGFRMLAASKGITIAANMWGKLKTVIQMSLVIVILCDFAGILTFLSVLITPLIVLTIVLTIVSAATYILDNKKVLQ